MGQHSIEKYLTDILIYIEELETFSHEINMQNIHQPINKWSVERALSIIGEALSQSDKLDKNLPITNKIQIIGLRHILVHDYDKIEAERLIIILKKHLSVLKTEVENHLKNLNS
jgi:uncharacterized protein with HEPN domain